VGKRENVRKDEKERRERKNREAIEETLEYQTPPEGHERREKGK
jgi:hypothetical protein